SLSQNASPLLTIPPNQRVNPPTAMAGKFNQGVVDVHILAQHCQERFAAEQQPAQKSFDSRRGHCRSRRRVRIEKSRAYARHSRSAESSRRTNLDAARAVRGRITCRSRRDAYSPNARPDSPLLPPFRTGTVSVHNGKPQSVYLFERQKTSRRRI